MGGTVLINGDDFFLSAKGGYYRRRAFHLSWCGSILLRGCYVVEREFTETVHITEEGGTVVTHV